MIEEIDIYRSAMIFVRKYGADAKTEAALQALSNDFDATGLSVWCRIVDAITQIQNEQAQTCVH